MENDGNKNLFWNSVMSWIELCLIMSTEISKHGFDLNTTTTIIYCEGNRTDGAHLADQYLRVAHAVYQNFY